MHTIIFALWFLLPAAYANVTPIVAAVTPGLRSWLAPVDFGRTFRGKRIFGDHKTWRGIVTGTLFGLGTFLLQRWLVDSFGWAQTVVSGTAYASLPWYFGGLIGFGALAGDAVKSFFKRQVGVPSGHRWVPFDQVDYIIGGIAFSLLCIRLSVLDYALMLVLWTGMHLVASWFGWRIGLKETPI